MYTSFLGAYRALYVRKCTNVKAMVTSYQWFLTQEHSLPQVLKSKQCVQNSGDIMFIPENWGHAVINLQPSIAVAVELH